MANTVYISDVINAPIERVWDVMRDFNGMTSYHPGIKKSIIEGEQPSDQIGCVRHLSLDPGFVRERLLCLDDVNHAFTYEIIESSVPVRNYVAGVRLHRVTQGNRTFAEWWADFDVVGPDRDMLIAHVGNNVFATGFKAVEAKLGGKPL